MKDSRPIHPDFQFFLDLKDQEVIELFTDLRDYILELYPDCNELVYHTHSRLDSGVFNLGQAIRRFLYVTNLHKPPKFRFQQRNTFERPK